tara:strand:- start:161612 stop:162532 length:921 start_codon:yes stop_codon:yes gene_type:complete
VSQYSTTDNYDFPGGSFTSLGDGKYYQYLRSHSEFIYDYSDNWSLTAGLTGSMATSDDKTDVRKSTRIHRMNFKAQYIAIRKGFQLVPEIEASFSLFDIADDVDEVLVDDDLTRLQFGAWLQKRFFTLNNYMYLGYQYRSDDFSSLGIYKIGTYKRLKNYYLGLELNGFSSLTDDKYVDTPINRTVITSRVNAGSLAQYAVNPSVTNASVWAGYNFARNFIFKLGYDQSINGESYGSGQTIWLKMEIRSIWQGPGSAPPANEQNNLKNEFVPSTVKEDETIQELFLGEEVEMELERKRRKSDDDQF